MLLGYDKETGTSYLSDMGSSEGLAPIHYLSRRTESSLVRVPKSGVIVYCNDTSVKDLYQSAIDPLITVHNISEDNLNQSLDLGGFAAPSLGVTRQKTPYSAFGEISLIGVRRTWLALAKEHPYSLKTSIPKCSRILFSKTANHTSKLMVY